MHGHVLSLAVVREPAVIEVCVCGVRKSNRSLRVLNAGATAALFSRGGACGGGEWVPRRHRHLGRHAV